MVLAIILIIGVVLIYKLWNTVADHNMEKQRDTVAPTVERISSELDQMGFITTSAIYVDEPVKQIKVDSKSKRVAICDYEADDFTCLNFKDILDCEIVEDSNVVCSSGIGRAVVGAVIAGEAGAIVGSNSAKNKDIINSLTVRIITSNIDYPQIVFEMLPHSMDKADQVSPYRPYLEHAREIYAIFHSIVLSNRSSSN